MTERERTRLSKLLSYHLRHDPAALALDLEPGGWVVVDTLLSALVAKGHAVTRAQLDEVVATSPKQRFAFDDAGQRIRANQGHSVDIDLQLEPAEPPATLFHGTTDDVASTIEREGLSRMARHHVHLSADEATARTVGSRRGRAIVFAIDAGAMHAAGIAFYRAANGVWLVDAVAPRWLRRVA